MQCIIPEDNVINCFPDTNALFLDCSRRQLSSEHGVERSGVPGHPVRTAEPWPLMAPPAAISSFADKYQCVVLPLDGTAWTATGAAGCSISQAARDRSHMARRGAGSAGLAFWGEGAPNSGAGTTVTLSQSPGTLDRHFRYLGTAHRDLGLAPPWTRVSDP